MSLLSSSTVTLRIVPGSVCGQLERGWRRPAVLARAAQAVDDAADLRAPGTALGAAIDATLAELDATQSIGGARMTVELADALVHLDVVAGDFAGEGDRPLQSIAQACVDELLGDAAPDVDVRWQLQRDGHHLLIAAIGRDLIATLQDSAGRHGVTLQHLWPDFCVQWNAHGARRPGDTSVFAVASGHDAVVALVEDGVVAAFSRGNWLDPIEAVPAGSEHVERLMCGFGLAPMRTARALDSRVDRLLASRGMTAGDPALHMLVAPPLPAQALSARWTHVERQGVTP